MNTLTKKIEELTAELVDSRSVNENLMTQLSEANDVMIRLFRVIDGMEDGETDE